MEMTTTTLMRTMDGTMNTTMNMTGGGTGNSYRATLTLASQWLNIVVLVLLMISMGVTIDLKDLKETFRRPAGFFVGMLCQFILMPLIALCLGLAFRLETAGAISMLIVACCPGGTLSNLFTVCMTVVSTAVAIGMMPLNLFIYARVWTDDSAVIPYVNIVTTLVSILIPAAFGVFIRWWKEEWTKYITKLGLVLAVFVIISLFTLFTLLNPNLWNAIWQLYTCAALLPLLGYALGYGIAFLLRQPHKKCRAISFETGSQNISLAATLILISFASSPLFLDMLYFPGLYGLFIYVDSFVVIIMYRLVDYLRKRNDPLIEKEQGEDNVVAYDNDAVVASDLKDGVKTIAMKKTASAENGEKGMNL